MTTLPAKTGWIWIKEGFSLFKKQPVGFSFLFLAYFFVMQLISIVPLIKILSLVTLPLFAMTLMQACADATEGKRLHPRLFLSVVRGPAVRPLLVFGTLYPIVAVVALAVSTLADGGLLWHASVGNGIDVANIPDGNIMTAIFVSIVVCIPAVMAFWYAAPLIAWHNMPISKALFYSFFAVARNKKAFIVFAVGWFMISIVLPSIISAFIAVAFGLQMAFAIALPSSMILTVIMYCSFYPTYTHVFDTPETKTTVPLPN